MKKTMLMILGLTILPAMAVAQSDFSGTWVVDTARSEHASDQNYWLVRSELQRRNPPALTVEHDGETLEVYEETNVLSRYDYPATYIADGENRTVTARTGVTQADITATWQEDGTLVIEKVQPWGGMPGNVTLETREVWKLSADGDQLYITTTHDSPARIFTYTQVYDRQ